MESNETPHGLRRYRNKEKCRCSECRAAYAAYMRDYRDRTPERRAHYAASLRKWRWKLRREVLAHYGGGCVCCGEAQTEFLSLDHISGGGTKHRQELGLRGSAIWAWAKREGYPEIFQVMCHNCNQAKGYYGYCPHRA